ncbi:MAG: MmgE/PrpD family protein, partial [Proteobacteria bacterium]|nr:MmgE/PrpD family protein [Pseudomonadota bacterium]
EQALADLAIQPVTPAEIERARRMRTYAIDTLAVTLVVTVAPSSAAVARTILAAAGKAEATVLGAGRVTSAWDAALANGAFAHALELDDDHRIAVLHPGAVVVPAALAAAEAANASGLAFLRALLMGYEVACRLGEVFRGSQFYHGVHPTAVCGVFGAAAAAGVAMGLDRDAMVRALGIAGTQASGLTEWRADGSWIKRLHPGRAAHAGVLSARLAREGFTGPATIFEGDNGFFNAFSYGETIDALCMTRDLGSDYRALGTAIKPYPCCRFEHGAIDLAIEARESGIAAANVGEIAIRIYRTDVLSYHHEPKSPVDAQFNVPYGVAVALLRGKISLSDFTDAAIRDEQVLAISRRVNVVEDSEYTARYPNDYWIELKLKLRDGGERRFFSECPSGDPEAPEYRNAPDRLQAEVERKSAALLYECGFGERADALRQCVASLTDAPNVHGLTAILGAPPVQSIQTGRRST